MPSIRVTSSSSAGSMTTAPSSTSSSIRFLILSDTHDTAFPSKLPPSDVVLHCGDMTMIGGLSNYKSAIRSLASCDAELKLVIPGNHDVSLDPSWWIENLDEDDDDPKEPQKAQSLFKNASNTWGVRFLEEGVHRFTLEDGRSFSVFASPYTPAFGGYAFAYDQNQDHWSSAPEGVDIVMTHGPPLAPNSEYRLDLGHRGEHCGCPKLWDYIQRAKPRIHCFGHIHEGHGVAKAIWREGDTMASIENIEGVTGATMDFKSAVGDQTLLINAAIMTHGDEDNNTPWVVDVEL